MIARSNQCALRMIEARCDTTALLLSTPFVPSCRSRLALEVRLEHKETRKGWEDARFTGKSRKNNRA